MKSTLPLLTALLLAPLAAMPAPADLRVGEGFVEPIGFHNATPTLSWKLPADAGAKQQSAYGAIGQWMYERIAGLEPDPAQPGYKHFFIRPQPGGPLTSARAELITPYGTALSAWKIENGILKLKVVVPPNTTATLMLPGKGVTTLPPGQHEFESKHPGNNS